MRSAVKLAGVLLVLGVVAGLLLGVVNAVTEGPIASYAQSEAVAALEEIFPLAQFQSEPCEGTDIDACFRAQRDGEILGYIARVTVNGFRGEFEVSVGMDMQGKIAGVQVGGANFQETVDLGSKVRGGAFTGQYVGASAPFELKKDIDAVSGATVSSRAVNDGVNRAAGFLAKLVERGE